MSSWAYMPTQGRNDLPYGSRPHGASDLARSGFSGRWGFGRAERHCATIRGPPVPHRNPEILRPKGCPQQRSCPSGRLRCRVIPLPFGLDFCIAAVPSLLSPRGKVSGEGPLRGPFQNPSPILGNTRTGTTPQRTETSCGLLLIKCHPSALFLG